MQLDSLVATLDIRTEDLEKRLNRFSGLLDESLEAASTRAREVARLVSEASAEGTRAISEQYERVRENAEEERERAAEAMRAIYEQTAGDTESLFRNANERFAEAVQGMKQMAAEMQRELEATRGELRRGVFELPQETAESAAQMRRVIVDQIEALAELNRIVARHGRNLDAVEPVRRDARGADARRRRRPQRDPRRAANPHRATKRRRRRAMRSPRLRHAPRLRASRRADRAAGALADANSARPRLAHRSAQPRLARGRRAAARIATRDWTRELARTRTRKRATGRRGIRSSRSIRFRSTSRA